MLDKKLTRPGRLVMEKGKIHLDDFDVSGSRSCRESVAVSLLWAIGELQRELAEIIDRPGGTGNVSFD